MAVRARERVGDVLERLHVRPEVSGLDAGQQLLRRVVHAAVARPRRRRRRCAGWRDQAYGKAGCDEPRLGESRLQAVWHEILPLDTVRRQATACQAAHTNGTNTRGAARLNLTWPSGAGHRLGGDPEDAPRVWSSEAARAATTVGGFSPQENPKAPPLSLVRHKIVGRLHR